MGADVRRSEVEEVKYLPIQEFADGGYLQEVNRRLLHPLGLALEVGTYLEPGRWFTLREEDVARLERIADLIRDQEPAEAAALDGLIAGSERLEVGQSVLRGVWDCRDDPEGIIFGDGLVDPEKAHAVTDQLNLRSVARMAKLGFLIQDVEPPEVVEV